LIVNHLQTSNRMIITKTPYRISLFGGGTDYPSWYMKNTGAVLSLTIDKYSYISLRELPPFFEHKFRIVYSKNELVSNITEIQHPAVREAFRKFAPQLNLELLHHGDLPARSGIGSSSAFSVGLIKSLFTLNEMQITPKELAETSIEFEQKVLKENVGSQDQVACSFGGVNYIEFGPGPYWVVNPINLSHKQIEEIEERIVLVFTGINRFSSDVSKTLLEKLESKSDFMKRNMDLAKECRSIFMEARNLNLIGKMLNEAWQLKQRINPKSVTPELERIYNKGIASGAEGGKILGAGGGGFFLFWVNPERRVPFIIEMHDFTVVPIKISSLGSTIIQ